MAFARVILGIVALVALAGILVEGAYRKPPFNGSIFGKRASTVTDYEIVSRALTAMCELASETCSPWLAHQDTN